MKNKISKLLSLFITAAMIVSLIGISIPAVAADTVAYEFDPDNISEAFNANSANGGYWNTRTTANGGVSNKVADPEDASNYVLALGATNNGGKAGSCEVTKNISGYDLTSPFIFEYSVYIPEITDNGYGTLLLMDLSDTSGNTNYNLARIVQTEDSAILKSWAAYSSTMTNIATLNSNTWYHITIAGTPTVSGSTFSALKSIFYVENMSTNVTTKTTLNQTSAKFSNNDGTLSRVYMKTQCGFTTAGSGVANANGPYTFLIDDVKFTKTDEQPYTISVTDSEAVPCGGPIEITSSRMLDAQTALAENMTLESDEGDEIGVSVTSASGNSVIITPSESLNPESDYTITFDAVADLFGNAPGNISAGFTTSAKENIPYNWSISPTTDVSSENGSVTLTFENDIDTSTLIAPNISITDESGNSASFTLGTITSRSAVINFASLTKSMTYNVILSGVSDINGNVSTETKTFRTEESEFIELLPDLTKDTAAFNARYSYASSGRSGLNGLRTDFTANTVLEVGAYHYAATTASGFGQKGTSIDGTEDFLLDFDLYMSKPTDTFYLANSYIYFGNLVSATSFTGTTDLLQIIPVLGDNGIPASYDLKVRVGSAATYNLKSGMEYGEWYHMQISCDVETENGAYSLMNVTYYIDGEQITSTVNEVTGEAARGKINFPAYKVSTLNPSNLGIMFSGTSTARPATSQAGVNAAMCLDNLKAVKANVPGTYTVTPTENVESYGTFTMEFSRLLDYYSVLPENFEFLDPNGNQIELLNSTLQSNGKTVEFRLTKTLNANSTYTVAPVGVRDIYGQYITDGTEINTLETMEVDELQLSRPYWSTNANPTYENEITELPLGETLYCKLKYISTSESSMPLTQVTALYNGKKLVDLDLNPITLPANGIAEYITSVDIPETSGEYIVKTFVITNLSNLKPVNGTFIFPVQ